MVVPGSGALLAEEEVQAMMSEMRATQIR